MANPSPWPAIHAERQALVEDLEPLEESQWRTPSLCDGWSVAKVVGHMTATTKNTPPKFFAAMIGAGFRFDAMVSKGADRESEGSGAETLARFKAQIATTTHPPGPLDTWLGEMIVHAEDIRRPLGISHSYEMAAVVRVADFYKGSNLIVGAKKRVAGLTLKATDSDWTTGAGPEVSGPMVALVLAMTGRKPAVDDLSGDGVATLKSRM